MNRTKCLMLWILVMPILAFGQSEVYNKAEILEDIFYLQSQLNENHPNIEVYTTTRDFKNFFDNIVIPDSLTELEAYSIFAATNEVIQDGHTLFYPNQKIRNRNNEFGFFLPLQPFWDGSKLYIIERFNDSEELIPGDEILSINGVKSQELIQGMLNKMMRDGNNFNYPIWVLNTYFFEYYSYFYGCSKEYELILNDDGTDKFIYIKGISKPELFQKFNRTKEDDEKGISLHIDKNTATLTIKDWHKNKLLQKYNQKFIPEVNKIIHQIENSKIENLIIDIRNNQGGEPKYSKYLLSYLLQESFILVEGYNKTKKGKVVKCRGPEMGIHKPLSSTFTGNVYVLINGGSFSNSGIFCSVLKKYNRAIFIGEETGGSEFVLCGHPKNIKLPNTEIIIELPRLQYLIKSYSNEELHGILPDFVIKPTVESLIKGKDIVIEYTLKLIKENSSQQELKRE